ncbi:MAG: FAD-dependent oxidoreductase [Patescibacteria group bacterium]
MEKQYDLIIIGGGPGAITAGIYAARKKIKTLLLTKDWNGQMNWTNFIENYPGFESITGPELVKKMVAHLEKYRGDAFDIKEGTEVKEIERVSDSLIKVKANDHIFEAKALIVSTGRHYRKLGVPGEEEFANKGVSYCPVCDAPFFKDKEVAVIGGGNAGAETVFDLLKYASKIYLLGSRDKLNCDDCFRERIIREPKVSVILHAQVKEIKGEKFVSSLIYQDKKTEQTKELSVQGVFVEIGTIANSTLLENVVELNKAGEIKINARNQTSAPNIFAAGDVTDISHKQVVIAAGEGAKAVLNAQEYLEKLN